MKKQILLAVGVAGLLTCQPQPQAFAGIKILGVRISGDPKIHLTVRPDFVYLNDYGFSVSYGAPYDVIYYGDDFFIFREGSWYRSQDYKGPWRRVMNMDLPPAISRHRLEEIKRYRDVEYRRHDRRYWDDRFRHDRDDWRGHNEHRERPDDRRGPDEHRGPDDRRGPDEHRGPDDRKGPDGGRDYDRRDQR